MRWTRLLDGWWLGRRAGPADRPHRPRGAQRVEGGGAEGPLREYGRRRWARPPRRRGAGCWRPLQEGRGLFRFSPGGGLGGGGGGGGGEYQNAGGVAIAVADGDAGRGGRRGGGQGGDGGGAEAQAASVAGSMIWRWVRHSEAAGGKRIASVRNSTLTTASRASPRTQARRRRASRQQRG